MGVYSEYLNARLTGPQIEAERRKQLTRISQLRGGRDALVVAANIAAYGKPVFIDNSDITAINDQLAFLSGTGIDVLLETPGGYAEVVEDIVSLLWGKYKSVAFIIPGTAKSAGTIMAMAGDEILMGPSSSLGPIDAQITWQGKTFSADALLDGFEAIKKKAKKTLNRAYVPLLSALSPGELQAAKNAQDFARALVSKWLIEHKFRAWEKHSTTGQPVTKEEKIKLAKAIARKLADNSKWLTHGRSIRIEHLRSMGLRLTDYSESPDLLDAITRYDALMRLSFEGTAYKIFETPTSTLAKHAVQAGAANSPPTSAQIELKCAKCGKALRIQANFQAGPQLEAGSIRYPKNDVLKCPDCGFDNMLEAVRKNIEQAAGRPIIHD